jgi:AcrR family transcriptional regulator
VRKPITGPAPLIWTQPPPPPRQRSLGRAEIVAAAISLADEAGAGALSMQAVATRLGPY